MIKHESSIEQKGSTGARITNQLINILPLLTDCWLISRHVNWISSQSLPKNSWLLLFLANVTRTGEHSAFVWNYFQVLESILCNWIKINDLITRVTQCGSAMCFTSCWTTVELSGPEKKREHQRYLSTGLIVFLLFSLEKTCILSDK